MTIRYMRRPQAAAYLKEYYGTGSIRTLAKQASIGGGPRFRKFGRFPIYTPEELDDWAAKRLSAPVENTSQL